MIISDGRMAEFYRNTVEKSSKSSGLKAKILHFTQKQLAGFLSKKIENDYQDFYILPGVKQLQLREQYNASESIDIVHFMNHTDNDWKVQKYRKIIDMVKNLQDADYADKTQSIIQQANHLSEMASNDINNESLIVALFNDIHTFLGLILEKQDALRGSLLALEEKNISRKKIIDNFEDSESDFAYKLFTMQREKEVRSSVYQLFESHIPQLDTVHTKANESILLFLKAFDDANYVRARDILELWKPHLTSKYLRGFQKQLISYLDLLIGSSNSLSSIEIESMKNIMTKNVHRLQNDLEVHLFQSIHDVIKEDIHPDIWRDFRSLEQMGVELHALLELASTEYATHSFKSVCLRALHAGQVGLMSEDILKKKKFRITPEFIDSIIESKIEKLLMQSAKNFIADEKREEKELNQYKRKVQRQKVMNRMSRAAAVVTTIATKALLFVGAILMGLFMGLLAFLKGARNLESSAAGFRDGMKDLLNGVFDSSLRSMKDSDDLPNQRDLLSREVEKLSGVNVLNYDKLDSTLLVGEIFYRFLGDSWEKESIDHLNKHILETNLNGVNITDYSFFLDDNDWEVHYPTQEDYNIPTLIIDSRKLKEGPNSIPCPRGYIPVLTDDTKEILEELDIEYEIYCIKDKGYYYINLSNTPSDGIRLYYYRYGDTDFNGIFFNTQKHTSVDQDINPDSSLMVPMLTRDVLPNDIQEKVSDIFDEFDDINTRADEITRYISSYFLYSMKKKHTTSMYDKYDSYLGGVAHTAVGDCKNVNTLNIALLREMLIPAQECAGYVLSSKTQNFEGHGITEINDSGRSMLFDATPSEKIPDTSDTKFKDMEDLVKQITENVADFLLGGVTMTKEFYEKYKPKVKIDLPNFLIRRRAYMRQRELHARFEVGSYDMIVKKIATNHIDFDVIKGSTDNYKEFLRTFITRAEWYLANKDAIYRETALPNGVIVDNEYRSTTYNHYLLVLQLESTIDTLNTLFGVNLQLETLFVVLKEMDTFETDVDMNYHLIFVEKLLATQGVKVDKKRVFTQLKKTDSLEAVFDGISTLKDSESPLDLLLPISFESTPNWKKYEKNKKYEHSKDTEKQIKLGKKSLSSLQYIEYEMMRKLHKKKYHMEGSFNIDLFKQLVQEAFAITYDDFSIQQCDDSTHEHFDLVNKKLSNQEKTKIFPDTKKYTLLNQAIEVFISVVAGGTPGELGYHEMEELYQLTHDGNGGHTLWYSKLYQIVCPIGNFHPGYENSNYLSYLSDESFVSNPYNLLCLLEDVAGKKGLLDLTSITKIEVIENHTDQQMTLTDLEVVEAKITSIIETKYKYHDHAMALLIKYQGLTSKNVETLESLALRTSNKDALSVCIQLLMKDIDNRPRDRKWLWLPSNSFAGLQYESLCSILSECDGDTYSLALSEILSYFKSVSFSTKKDDNGLNKSLFSQAVHYDSIFHQIIDSEALRKRKGKTIGFKSQILLARLKNKSGNFSIGIGGGSAETDTFRRGY